MGRFVHEAVAVDPRTGWVYETEDRDTSGIYRFVPRRRGFLQAGGTLEMLAVRGEPNYDTRTGQTVGERLRVKWVPIEEPDPPGAEENPLAVYEQGRAHGAATFARLEGAWYGDGSVFFHSTSGGDAGLGQVWQLRLGGPHRADLFLIYESDDALRLDAPDNITVNPHGGLVLCEDGDGEQHLRTLSEDGTIADFALNVLAGFDGMEFAGATFSPDGETLFVNVQTPGVTFAIWGPWGRAAATNATRSKRR
jgi:secreted PhoX family phosphatase